MTPPDLGGVEPKPNPGSDAALALGCKCAVLDNGHGRGSLWGDGVFVITVGCPVHHPEKEEE